MPQHDAWGGPRFDDKVSFLSVCTKKKQKKNVELYSSSIVLAFVAFRKKKKDTAQAKEKGNAAGVLDSEPVTSVPFNAQ